MINFLTETVKKIKDSGHSENDVMFVGSCDGEYRMTWEKFKEKANFQYDNGYGAAGIAMDLIVYFFDGSFLSRLEYDGSEWWKYNDMKRFEIDDDYKDFDVLGGNGYMWDSVEEMNTQSDLQN